MERAHRCDTDRGDVERPADRPHAWHGKRGQHSEHLGYILAEMQYLQRSLSGRALVNAVLERMPAMRTAHGRGAHAAAASGGSVAAAWTALAAVEDPEIPAFSIVDLGLVRGVEARRRRRTRGGVISHLCGLSGDRSDSHTRSRRRCARRGGPFWRDHGAIAAPGAAIGSAPKAGASCSSTASCRPSIAASMRHVLRDSRPVACPRCQSTDTECVSEFGSTPCKALHRCRACLEPFEYFKCI